MRKHIAPSIAIAVMSAGWALAQSNIDNTVPNKYG